MRKHAFGLITASLLAAMTLSTVVFAQVVAPQNPAPPRPGQGPTVERAQGARRQGQRRGVITLSMIPGEVIHTSLGLDDDQFKKTKAIQDKMNADIKAAREENKDPTKRQEIGQKVLSLHLAATTEIEGLLTDAQKKKLPDMMKQVQSLLLVGIPPQALNELKLTGDQLTKITDVAKDLQTKVQAIPREERRTKVRALRTEAHEKAVALLTDAQKTVLKKYPTGQGARRQPTGSP